MSRGIGQDSAGAGTQASADRDAGPAKSTSPSWWEKNVAWILRLLILATAVTHLTQGKYLYALLCGAVIAVVVAPPLLARSSSGNIPVELELAALRGAVSDMTLGRLAGLYGGTVWFDKVLHFGNSLLVGLLAFLIVYALRFTGRLKPRL